MTAPRRAHGGQALIVTLFVLVVLMSAMALVAAALHHRAWLLQREEQTLQLTALTDAALARALAQLSLSGGYAGAPEEPFAHGTIAIGVEALGYPRVAVTVEATYRGARRTVRAEVLLDSQQPPRVIRWEPVRGPRP